MTEQTSAITEQTLSAREREIISLLSMGNSPDEIGMQLSISEGTVFTYINRARKKLNAINRSHLVAIAVAAKLIPSPLPDEPSPEESLEEEPLAAAS